METFGNRIKHFRELLGLSQLALSQKSNVSQASIARIEAGKQKNLKRETIKKLADGLDISLTDLMEYPAAVKEEIAPYSSVRKIPVVTLKDIMKTTNIYALIRKAVKHEPSLSSDRNAFYLLTTAEFTNEPLIVEGDLILIEPSVAIREGDMVLYFSKQNIGIGKIYYYPDSFIIRPPGHNMPPLLFKKNQKKHAVHILRISEIKKKG